MTKSNRHDEIVERAECLSRQLGYGGFSFRDLAQATNVKSASVHYYFPTKEDLAVVVARRYAQRVYDRLGDPQDPAIPAAQKMDSLIDVFRDALSSDGRVCLFLVYGAEMNSLPEGVKAEVRDYFAQCLKWLAKLLERYDEFAPGKGKDASARASAIIAALNGAMISVRVAGNLSAFEYVVTELRRGGLIPTA